MTLELRGSARPTLQQALRWIGSRVDDIYGASIGKLEDIWMDPDSGEPLWLLVRDGRIGGRHTLVPFAQAASGAGHVWIPFEREVVRGAPAVRPSAPLSHELSDTLRRYYAESGHPVVGEARSDDVSETELPADAQRVPAHAAAAPQSRRPSPRANEAPPEAPPRHEPRRNPSWSSTDPAHRAARGDHPAAPPPAAPPASSRPLPPLPQMRGQSPHADMRAPSPAPSQERWTPAPGPWQAPRQFEPPPMNEPLRPDRIAQQPPPPPADPDGQPPPTLDELRLTIGDGVDMELVGRLQFRGNVVRMQPLRGGTEVR
ncbi:MAG: PRC-barrel domain-containing protein [Solirubrobacterales bacterium]